MNNKNGMVWIKYKTTEPNQTAVKAFCNTDHMAEWIIIHHKEVDKILDMWKE